MAMFPMPKRGAIRGVPRTQSNRCAYSATADSDFIHSIDFQSVVVVNQQSPKLFSYLLEHDVRKTDVPVDVPFVVHSFND